MANKKMKPCPYCGTEVYAGKHKHVPGKWIVRCGSTGEKCSLFPSSGAITKKEFPKVLAAWNRRHVCDDRNGQPVYAGDRAKAADCEGKVDRLGGIRIESEDGHLHHVWPSEIELVEDDND